MIHGSRKHFTQGYLSPLVCCTGSLTFNIAIAPYTIIPFLFLLFYILLYFTLRIYSRTRAMVDPCLRPAPAVNDSKSEIRTSVYSNRFHILLQWECAWPYVLQTRVQCIIWGFEPHESRNTGIFIMLICFMRPIRHGNDQLHTVAPPP